MPRLLSFEYVLTPRGIERGQRLTLDDQGRIQAIDAVGNGPGDGALALPGMPNAPSHCFQRALVGMPESARADSFWAWQVGRHADLVVLDLRHSSFGEVPPVNALDAWLVGGDGRQIAADYIGGARAGP